MVKIHKHSTSSASAKLSHNGQAVRLLTCLGNALNVIDPETTDSGFHRSDRSQSDWISHQQLNKRDLRRIPKTFGNRRARPKIANQKDMPHFQRRY